MAQAIEMTVLAAAQMGGVAGVRVMAAVVNGTMGQRMWTFRRNPA